MKKTLLCSLLILIATLCFGNASAEKKEPKKEQPSPTPELKLEGVPPEKAAEIIKKLEAMRKIESELKFQKGVILVGKNLAKITLPENFPSVKVSPATSLWTAHPAPSSGRATSLSISCRPPSIRRPA